MFTVVFIFNFKHEYSLLCESVWVQWLFNVVGDFHWGWPPLVLSFFRTSSIKIVYTIQSSVVSFPFIGFRFSDLVPCYIPVPHRIRSWTHACRHDFFPLLPQLVLLLWQLLPRRRASLRQPRLMRRNSRFPMVAATLRRMLRLKASKTILTRTAYVVQTSAALAKPYGCHSCQLFVCVFCLWRLWNFSWAHLTSQKGQAPRFLTNYRLSPARTLMAPVWATTTLKMKMTRLLRLADGFRTKATCHVPPVRLVHFSNWHE